MIIKFSNSDLFSSIETRGHHKFALTALFLNSNLSYNKITEYKYNFSAVFPLRQLL
ncbi:hypothetical protein PROVRETT_08778 [Providencia rettgeri DSM 1131]|nr:hypothetical protein PROVRETT_08778 [Providencia rettgeri DSM 1131]